MSDDRPLIVGGGHTGLLLAIGLARYGLRATVIDPAAVDDVMSAPFEGRALALMRGSKTFFDDLDIWRFFGDIATPILQAKVTDGVSGAMIDYESDALDGEPFGYGIETRQLKKRLLEIVLERPEITYVERSSVAGIDRTPSGIDLHLDDGKRIHGCVVLAADGRQSTMRGLARIPIHQLDYRQTAITLAFRHEATSAIGVREYLRPAGPLALLPIGSDRCSVTWVERPARASELLRLDDEALLAALSSQLDRDIRAIEIIGRPTAYPLGARTAVRFASPRVALLGDAAHGLHPIHAQGWNLGVRDVATLINVLVRARSAGLDLGSGEILQRYARQREGDAMMIFALTDGLNRLFSTELLPAQMIRQAGLRAASSLTPLKNWLMRQGMGKAIVLPELAAVQEHSS